MLPMNGSQIATSPLVIAAESLEKGLGALDQLATQLERFSISSEKTLQRSASMLLEAGRLHEELAAGLAGLSVAIGAMQQRQEALLTRVLAETRRVESRSTEYRELMRRFAALGERARDVNGPVGDVVARKDAGASPEGLLEALASVEELALGVARDAESVASSARTGDWPQVATDAHALRQTMEAARNKLTLARREIAARASS
jgi:hypothetical protein